MHEPVGCELLRLPWKGTRRANWPGAIALGLTAILAVLSLFPTWIAPPAQPTPASTEIRGVWLTNVASGVLFVPWGVNRAIWELAKLDFNTLYPVVWNRGHTFYPSAVARRATGRSQDGLLWLTHPFSDPLRNLVRQAHHQNLRVIPWFEYGFMAPANAAIARRHPDWLAMRRDGSTRLREGSPEVQLHELGEADPEAQTVGQRLQASLTRPFRNDLVWLNPLHPAVQKFLLTLIVEVVIEYDIDGIQLDDHFGLPVSFGYDPITVELYRQDHDGISPPDDPRHPEWVRWRADRISDFMQRLVNAIEAVSPDCQISLSPNPSDYAYRHYLQDWSSWVERGWLDELIVQVYRNSNASFEAELAQETIRSARDRIPVGIGILSGTWNNPVEADRIARQVRTARDRGFDGVSFFYWESLWGYIAPESPRARRRAFKGLF